MKKLVIAGFALTTLLGAGSAFAQVDARHYDQESRIRQGERSGELRPGEAAQLQRQQGRIDRTEERMRDRNGGYLRPGQRARLEARENRASRHIYRLKHNGRTY